MNLVAEVGFDQSFSFLYSRRPAPGGAAGRVPHGVKQQARTLLVTLERPGARHLQRVVGSRQRVLIERPAAQSRRLAGRTGSIPLGEFRPGRGPAMALINSFADVIIAKPCRIPARALEEPP